MPAWSLVCYGLVGRFSLVHSGIPPRSQYTEVKPDSTATLEALYDFQHSAPLQKKTTGCDLSSFDRPPNESDLESKSSLQASSRHRIKLERAHVWCCIRVR